MFIGNKLTMCTGCHRTWESAKELVDYPCNCPSSVATKLIPAPDQRRTPTYVAPKKEL